MRAYVLSKSEVILIAIFPFIAVGLLNAFYLPDLSRSNASAYWTADFGHWLVVPALSLWFLLKQGGVRPSEFGFARLAPGTSDRDMAALIIAITFLYWLAYDPVKLFMYRLFPLTAESNAFIYALPTVQPWKWLFVLYASLTAAIIEEPVFRSLPWLYFETHFSKPVLPYVVSTSVLFAAIHSEQGVPGVVAAGSVGIVAACMYSRIRNIWPFIIAHFLSGVWSYEWF